MVCDEYFELLLNVLPRDGRVTRDVVHVLLAELDGTGLILVLLYPATDGGSGVFGLNLGSGLLYHGHYKPSASPSVYANLIFPIKGSCCGCLAAAVTVEIGK